MCQERAVYTEQYRGHTIRIEPDMNAQDPYGDCDGMWPMIVNGGRSFSNHDYNNASDVLMPTDAQYRRHKRALMEVLDYTEDPDYSAEQTKDEVMDMIGDAIKQHDVDILAGVARTLGVPHLETGSIGYSQGDQVDILVVWTDAFGEEIGKTKRWAKSKAGKESMEGNVEYWGAWAWGDVYGYMVDGPSGDDSCWGYHDRDGIDGDSEVVKEARSAIDAGIAHDERKENERRAQVVREHIHQVKAWIKNHVPVIHRHPLQF